MPGLAAWPTPLPCQNQGEIHGRVRIAYHFRAFRHTASPERYAMRTLQSWSRDRLKSAVLNMGRWLVLQPV